MHTEFSSCTSHNKLHTLFKTTGRRSKPQLRLVQIALSNGLRWQLPSISEVVLFAPHLQEAGVPLTNDEFTHIENAKGALVEIKHDVKDKGKLRYNYVQRCCSEVSINDSLRHIRRYKPQAEAA